MPISISKDFSFSASHVLGGLPTGHKCARLHGHSYRVRAKVSGRLDDAGMVIDYGQLDWLLDLLNDNLDHRHLNDVLDRNPTAENLAEWILDRYTGWLRGLPGAERLVHASIGVSETQATWAVAELSL